MGEIKLLSGPRGQMKGEIINYLLGYLKYEKGDVTNDKLPMFSLEKIGLFDLIYNIFYDIAKLIDTAGLARNIFKNNDEKVMENFKKFSNGIKLKRDHLTLAYPGGNFIDDYHRLIHPPPNTPA